MLLYWEFCGISWWARGGSVVSGGGGGVLVIPVISVEFYTERDN